MSQCAAMGNTSGIPFHVGAAKAHGASRQEVLSAVLLGLPAAGAVVIGALPASPEAYDGGARQLDPNPQLVFVFSSAKLSSPVYSQEP